MGRMRFWDQLPIEVPEKEIVAKKLKFLRDQRLTTLPKKTGMGKPRQHHHADCLFFAISGILPRDCGDCPDQNMPIRKDLWKTRRKPLVKKNFPIAVDQNPLRIFF